MTDTDLKNLRAALEGKRLEIAAQLRGRVKELTIEDSQAELVDWIQRMTDRDETAGMLSRFSSTLAEVERSLRAVEENSYGICQRCEEPIPLKRLHSIPWAAYCVQCQEQRERAEAQGSAWDLDQPQAA